MDEPRLRVADPGLLKARGPQGLLDEQPDQHGIEKQDLAGLKHDSGLSEEAPEIRASDRQPPILMSHEGLARGVDHEAEALPGKLSWIADLDSAG
jgi:hypothetical protein